MKITKKTTYLIGSIALVMSMVGCSKNEEPSSSANEASKPNLTDAISQSGQEQAVIVSLPQGDANTPENQYKDLTSDEDIMFTYYALTTLPIDYDKILMNYSNDYRSASDEFKKQDIIKALKPKVDQELSAAKNSRYLKMTWNHFNLNKYNFNDKGFAQNELTSASNLGFRSYRLTFSNADAFKLFKVEDEAKARLIEEKRSKFEPLNLVVYLYAQDVDLNESNVKTQVMKVVLQDKNGVMLFSQSK